MGEILGAIITAFIEISFYLLSALVFPFRYLMSSEYRNNKTKEWESKKWSKYRDLGGVALWIALVLIIVPIWMKLLSTKHDNDDHNEKQGIEITITDKNDEEKELLKIELNAEDVKELMKTENVNALAEKLKEKIKYNENKKP